MEAHRLAGIAGSITMLAMGAAHFESPAALFQQGTNPQPQTSPQPGRSEAPSTNKPLDRSQPNRSLPALSPTNQTPGGPINPPGSQPTNPNGVVPLLTPNGVVPATTTNGRFFAFQNPGMEAQFNQFSTQVTQAETQLNANNQKLLKQLGQARQLTGDRRAEALGEVMQGILQNDAATMQYVAQLRSAITGQIGNNDGTMPATPSNMGTPATPGTTNPTTTTTNPGSAPANNPRIER